MPVFAIVVALMSSAPFFADVMVQFKVFLLLNLVPEIAGRIIEVLSMPFLFGEVEVAVGCSLGIALAGDPSETADLLHRRADSALYRAKAAGRGVWQLAEGE